MEACWPREEVYIHPRNRVRAIVVGVVVTQRTDAHFPQSVESGKDFRDCPSSFRRCITACIEIDGWRCTHTYCVSHQERTLTLACICTDRLKNSSQSTPITTTYRRQDRYKPGAGSLFSPSPDNFSISPSCGSSSSSPPTTDSCSFLSILSDLCMHLSLSHQHLLLLLRCLLRDRRRMEIEGREVIIHGGRTLPLSPT